MSIEPIVITARVRASAETIWETVTADQAFSRLFHRGFGPVPGVARTERANPDAGPVPGNYHIAHLVQRLPFGVVRAAGQTKEQYDHVVPPRDGKPGWFEYTVTGFPAPFPAIVTAGHGRFALEPDRESTVVTFSYTFDQKDNGVLNGVTKRLLSLAMKAWKSNMERAMQQLVLLSESADEALRRHA